MRDLSVDTLQGGYPKNLNIFRLLNLLYLYVP
jgi:hypothetical protein